MCHDVPASEIHLRQNLNCFSGGVSNYDEILDASKDKLDDIEDHFDKIKFINIVLAKNNLDYQNHLRECRDLINCRHNYKDIDARISFEIPEGLVRWTDSGAVEMWQFVA